MEEDVRVLEVRELNDRLQVQDQVRLQVVDDSDTG